MNFGTSDDLLAHGKHPAGLQVINAHVSMATDDIVQLRLGHLTWLKEAARASPRQRARICTHRRDTDAVHEMLIAMTDRSYVRPHRHLAKSESFHVVSGSCDVVVFDDNGTISQVIEIGEVSSGRAFFYRLDSSRFHTLYLRTPFLVIHEVTNGPFVAGDSVLASFAPDETDLDAGARWMLDLGRQIDAFLSP